MKIGFIGLGNVGSKLAASLLRNGFDLTVRDLNGSVVRTFLENGARVGESPAKVAQRCDVLITCLPDPATCALVVEGTDGLLDGLSPGKIWCEMSTTDHAEVVRLGAKIREVGAEPADCPVSGGCHRAASGNISILAGCERATFERVLPVLSVMGRNILHTGPLGSASVLKVVTNYLASANLASLCEALVASRLAGMDLGIAYEAIRISSGNSFVHETESQLILNGSRNIDFTMDLVLKDLGLFQGLASDLGLELEISPLLVKIFRDARDRYGPREWSTNVIRRLEDQIGERVLADGFPSELRDDEPELRGQEVLPSRRQ